MNLFKIGHTLFQRSIPVWDSPDFGQRNRLAGDWASQILRNVWAGRRIRQILRFIFWYFYHFWKKYAAPDALKKSLLNYHNTVSSRMLDVRKKNAYLILRILDWWHTIFTLSAKAISKIALRRPLPSPNIYKTPTIYKRNHFISPLIFQFTKTKIQKTLSIYKKKPLKKSRNTKTPSIYKWNPFNFFLQIRKNKNFPKTTYVFITFESDDLHECTIP